MVWILGSRNISLIYWESHVVLSRVKWSSHLFSPLLSEYFFLKNSFTVLLDKPTHSYPNKKRFGCDLSMPPAKPEFNKTWYRGGVVGHQLLNSLCFYRKSWGGQAIKVTSRSKNKSQENVRTERHPVRIQRQVQSK